MYAVQVYYNRSNGASLLEKSHERHEIGLGNAREIELVSTVVLRFCNVRARRRICSTHQGCAQARVRRRSTMRRMLRLFGLPTLARHLLCQRIAEPCWQRTPRLVITAAERQWSFFGKVLTHSRRYFRPD